MLKYITFRAEKALFERAHQRAESRNTNLNSEFRRWLSHYGDLPQTVSDLIAQLNYAKTDKTFTRAEMNER